MINHIRMRNENSCALLRLDHRVLTRCRRWLMVMSFVIFQLSFSVSCYNRGQQTPDAWDLTEQQLDSISFYTTHHYTQNYNFLVRSDSFPIVVQQPVEVLNEMPVDSLMLHKGDHLVVADIMTIPADSIDSVWVKVARDDDSQGWVHEHDLLLSVSPDDPISEFIDFFSDSHLLLSLAFLVIATVAYILRKLHRRGSWLVHFNDLPTIYPTLLCLLVAASATLYSSIQLFDPEKWRHFYFHPTLNPFAVPFTLGLFLTSVWSILIVAIAAFDDVRRQLRPSEAVLYFLGLVAVCAVDYVVFSVTTLYYIGYPLLLAYAVFALFTYFRHACARYVCGRCGTKLRQKGRCPHCGAENI